MEPRRDARIRVELLPGAVGRDERFVHRFAGLVVVAENPPRHRQQPSAVLADERVERPAVAGSEAPHDRGIVPQRLIARRRHAGESVPRRPGAVAEMRRQVRTCQTAGERLPRAIRPAMIELMTSRARVTCLCSAVLLIVVSGRDLGVRVAAATPVIAPIDHQVAQTHATPLARPQTEPIPEAAANPQTGWDERVIHVPVVGQAYIYAPRHPTTPNVALFMSGDGGWNKGVGDMARRMMPKAIVIGISYVALRRAPGPTTKCWMPSGDLEVIAHDAEKQLALPAYQPPLLVGYSSGATGVYEALAASPYSFAGGLAMGFCPDLPASHSVCPSDAFK